MIRSLLLIHGSTVYVWAWYRAAALMRKFPAACVSKITVEIATFLPCSLMKETEYNGGCFGCCTAGDVKRSRSIDKCLCCEFTAIKLLLALHEFLQRKRKHGKSHLTLLPHVWYWKRSPSSVLGCCFCWCSASPAHLLCRAAGLLALTCMWCCWPQNTPQVMDKIKWLSLCDISCCRGFEVLAE